MKAGRWAAAGARAGDVGAAWGVPVLLWETTRACDRVLALGRLDVAVDVGDVDLVLGDE